MKKVGIITFHNAHNYGAVLQTYALQTMIKRLGYNVFIINYINKNIKKSYRLIKLSKQPIKCIKVLIESLKYLKENKERAKVFNYFIEHELNLTKKVKNTKKLNTEFNDFDYFITGSDQVWNYEIVGGLSDAYTLNFGNKSITRISYAASIGNRKINDKYKQQFKEKLKNINFISVREEDARQELSKIIGKTIKVVLDPTLLLKREDWNNKLKDRKIQNEEYILAYVVKPNDEYRKIVDDLSQRTGLRVIHFEKENLYENELESAYTKDPFEFVNLIKNAKYIVTTSFHATVFSIIYHKKFFVIPHVNTGSRITSLLEKLKIENRIFYKLNDFLKFDYDLEINYEQIDENLEEERIKSIQFLKEALKK